MRKRDQKELKELQEKVAKMKKYEERLRLMPLKIDEEKKKEAAIMQDKLKNMKKYNFLREKALSDQQIYEEFQNFDININKHELGRQYMEDLR